MSSKSNKPDDYNVAHEKLEHVRSLQYDINLEQLKWFITLSAGAIALSVTFMSQAEVILSGLSFLYCSWAFFIYCIISCLLRFEMIDHHLTYLGESALAYLDGDQQLYKDNEVRSGFYSKSYEILNRLSFFYFIIALIMMSLFGFLNT